MKKFLVFATMVGAAFTSCVNDNEGVWQPEEESSARPITFEVAKYKPASRADESTTSETGNSLPKGVVEFGTDQTFGTFAYKTTNSQTGHDMYMDNVKVQYYSNGNYWAPERLTEVVKDNDGNDKTIEKFYVWPTDGHLDFISYYPYTATIVDETTGSKTYPSTIPQIDDTEEQKKLTYTYDITSEGAPHDLMYSDKAVHQTSNEEHYGFVGVPTLFHHALAKLNFAVRAVKLNNHLTAIGDEFKHEWVITVKSIALNSIYKAGTVEMTTPAPTGTTATTTQWTNSTLTNTATTNYNVWTVNTSTTTTNNTDGTVTTESRNPFMSEKKWEHSQELSTVARIYNGSATNLADRAENYFVIPQTLSNQAISIDYEIVTKDKDGNITNTMKLESPK